MKILFPPAKNRTRLAAVAGAFCAIGACIIAPAPLQAQSNRDLDLLLERLEKLAEQRSSNKDAQLRKVLPNVQRAASSGPNAVSAVTDGYRSIEFAGRPASDFVSWRDQNKATLNSNEFRAAAQLHAEYLSITLQRAASEKPEDFVRPSLEYLDKLSNAWSSLFSRQENTPQLQNAMLRTSVRDGVLAKLWELAPFLPDLRNWEFVPGNAEGILDKNIRPFLREQKDSRLVETWDWQMKFEESQFKPRDRSHAVEMFQTRRIPDLKMRQAADRAALGDPVQAARQGVEVLTQFPAHPGFDDWVASVRGWLEEARKNPVAEDAPASRETPGTEPAAPAESPESAAPATQ